MRASLLICFAICCLGTLVYATAPTITAIPAQVMVADSVKTVNFSVQDVDSPPDSLLVSATSSNTTLLQNAKILSTQTGNSRVLTITPEARKFGSATITVTVKDGGGLSASNSFLLTVKSAQPDISLRPSTVASYAGVGVVNGDGTNQSVSQSIANVLQASYYVHVQNKGNVADTFKITATKAPTGWTVVYKINNSSGADITADVTGAGWITPVVNPNATVTVAVYVTPGSTLLAYAATTLKMSATSVTNATQLDVALMTTSVALVNRPDISLRPSAVPTYTGMGVYNLTGANQTVGQGVAKNVKATYYLHVQNKGNVAETFIITGTAAPAGWTYDYKDFSAGTSIASAVTGAGWSTPLLKPGALVTLAVYATPAATVSGGTVATQKVTATSSGNPAQQDVGLMVASVAVVNRPDISVRPSAVTTYSGVGVYNLTGANQTVGLGVAKNVKATYYLHVQNNGNVAETFIITGTAAPAGWTYDYKDFSAGTSITSAVTGAGWSTPLLKAGALVTLAVYATPAATIIAGAVATQKVTATSSANPTQRDVGVLQTTVISAPTITSFTPTSGALGQVVTLSGTNFTGATAVKFNGTNVASYTVNNSTSITATVATGTTTGKITVTTSGGTASSATVFTVIPAPTITSFTPTSGALGQVVTLTGSNFTGASEVKFNGTVATVFTVVNATSITVTVPSGAITGKISITTSGGTVTSASDFTIIQPPSITDFSPISGLVGAEVTLTGANLTGATTVKFNGTVATTFTVMTDTSIVVTVPNGATTGEISITTPRGTVTSASDFTIIILSTNSTDGAEMVWVPGGTFTMGTDIFEQYAHQVSLSGYWIYKYEVTVAQYLAFCAATSRPLPPFPSGNGCWTGKSGWTDAALQQHPIVSVNWSDAKAYADWAGVQLPTEAQWEFAARGLQERNYPWGGTMTIDDNTNGWDQTKCANYLNSAIVGKSTWPVGSFPRGASWCGAQDMAGNVCEWCADWSIDLYSSSAVTDPTGPATGSSRVQRGGSWRDHYFYCRGAYRFSDSSGSITNDVGFRCVSSPQPTITDFTPINGPIGQQVTITGSHFTGASEVKFNGTVASVFTVVNATAITVTVPGGATSGKISITTPEGTVTSARDFNIIFVATNPTDGANMVWVPGGTFTMGTTWYEPNAHQVTLTGYWIYEYEVTVAQYRAFCAATSRPMPTFPSGNSWKGKSGWTDVALQQHPIVNVSRSDVQFYVDWAHVTLPTEAQWEYASRGPAGLNYPWGGIATSSDRYNGWDKTKCANNYNSNAVGISTWPVGSFPLGASWCGAQDMAGNVSEWCTDLYDYSGNVTYSSAAVTDPTGPASGNCQVARGGSWDGFNDSGRYRGAARGYGSGSSTPLGFRCVSVSPGP